MKYISESLLLVSTPAIFVAFVKSSQSLHYPITGEIFTTQISKKKKPVRKHYSDNKYAFKCVFQALSHKLVLFFYDYSLTDQTMQGQSGFLAHLSTKCSWWAIVINVRRASSTICFKS